MRRQTNCRTMARRNNSHRTYPAHNVDGSFDLILRSTIGALLLRPHRRDQSSRRQACCNQAREILQDLTHSNAQEWKDPDSRIRVVDRDSGPTETFSERHIIRLIGAGASSWLRAERSDQARGATGTAILARARTTSATAAGSSQNGTCPAPSVTCVAHGSIARARGACRR